MDAYISRTRLWDESGMEPRSMIRTYTYWDKLEYTGTTPALSCRLLPSPADGHCHIAEPRRLSVAATPCTNRIRRRTTTKDSLPSRVSKNVNQANDAFSSGREFDLGRPDDPWCLCECECLCARGEPAVAELEPKLGGAIHASIARIPRASSSVIPPMGTVAYTVTSLPLLVAR